MEGVSFQGWESPAIKLVEAFVPSPTKFQGP